MYLFQILLPLTAENGKAYLEITIRELSEKFGGVTAYSRSPALGVWETPTEEKVKDQIVIVEVMTTSEDRVWWQEYRKTLERRLKQDEVVIRIIPMEKV